MPSSGSFPAQPPAAHSSEGGGASAGQAEMAAATSAPSLVNSCIRWSDLRRVQQDLWNPSE